jgi:hypothetical protein
MKSGEQHLRSLQRALAKLGSVLRRGILGQAEHDSVNTFHGREEYWDRAIAGQIGWPANPDARDDIRPEEAEFDPVYGLPERELQSWLARNPAFRPAYEAQSARRTR